MNQLAEKEIDFAQLADRFRKMAEAMRQHKDEENAVKLEQLVEKTEQGELAIAFCGHFSAGKSTMINTLLGTPLLPSNPIPTSANVVKVRSGAAEARVYTRDQGVLRFDPLTQMEQLRASAVDGDRVEWVEISYPDLFLGEHASLLDTPGIDSTDAAHKIATESALHLADVIIYTMDYNHVQAEENFHFTKMCKDRGKPVFLVINMIDKHVDFELDFDSYKESVEDSFATWNIQPDGIFYTSLMEPDHPENQYEQFRQTLSELILRREELVRNSSLRAAAHLISEHEQFLTREAADERETWEERLETEVTGVDSYDQASVEQALQQTEAQLAELDKKLIHAQQEREGQLSDLLDNARLTYYSTNEAAKLYLESRKPGFKVGLLFAAKKTEEERANRLQALLADVREKVASNLEWHFKELLSKWPEKYGIHNEAYLAEAAAAHVEISAEFLAAHVKEGAGTDEYVLNYCNDISQAIKREYRRVGLAFSEQIGQLLAQQVTADRAVFEERAAQLRLLAEAHEQLASLSAQIGQKKEQLEKILHEGA